MSVNTPTPSRRPTAWYQELILRFENGLRETFYIERTRTGTHRPRAVREPASWTLLEHHRCPGCPLAASDRYCPAALSLEQTLDKLSGRTSYEVVEATAVDAQNRTTRVRWPLQEIGAIFVQLAVFSSGCPLGLRFKALLADLPPFATSQELAKHLVAQFLLRHQGRLEDCRAELEEAMESIHSVFTHLLRRLSNGRSMEGDAVPNSIARMDAFASCLSLQVDQLAGKLGRELGWQGQRPRPPSTWARLWGRMRSLVGPAALPPPRI